ncbi:MAG: monofunctional biosynthetic peptidoglycan transglycosylase, partial [Gammaproteobacteria bacterium]
MNATSTTPMFNLKSFREKLFTRRILLIILLALSGLILLDGLYLYSRVPDWSVYARGPIPKSSFMQRYENARVDHRDWPALRWRPIPLSATPRHLQRAVIVAEDSRFYHHQGIDLIAFREAMELNLKKGKMAYGASTISQQTVKNLFLSPSRDPLRKWHELVLTLMMEQRLSKSRILEIYLNIAEFGRGIYGVEAAAQHYYGKSAADLTLAEAAGLAASLPSPVKSNPATRSRYFVRHRDTILSRVTPRTPASDAAVAELPVYEPEALPTPEEEEQLIEALEKEQQLLEATQPADTDTSLEVTHPLEA